MTFETLQLVRAALAGKPAWLVGGAVRDRAMGRSMPDDLDVVVAEDPHAAAQQLARTARRAGEQATPFCLSHRHGGWRVIAPQRGWQVDIEPLRDGSLQADLLLRDFTVNAIAEPIAGGAIIDPLHGLHDLHARRLRAASPAAFRQDPVRVLRLARIATELRFRIEEATLKLGQASASALRDAAAERIFAELARIVDSAAALAGIDLLQRLGAEAVVLPEIDALRGVRQSRFHHLDVYEHTIEVLRYVIEIEEDPASVIGFPASASSLRPEVSRLLSEPLADGLTRRSALRWGALLHDVAKPPTRAVRAHDGRVTFVGHDVLGATIGKAVLRRLRASERFAAHVSALVANHLALGFLVHEPQPLARATVFDYLHRAGPVAVDVTLLSVADRLATRGDRAAEAIAAHLALAGNMLANALRWHADGPPRPLVRGDELARELSVAGPRIGELLHLLVKAQYVGEIRTRSEALQRARELVSAEREAG